MVYYSTCRNSNRTLNRDDKCIIFSAKSAIIQFIICKHLAARIRRVAEYERLGVLFERRLQLIRIEIELRRIGAARLHQAGRERIASAP